MSAEEKKLTAALLAAPNNKKNLTIYFLSKLNWRSRVCLATGREWREKTTTNKNNKNEKEEWKREFKRKRLKTENHPWRLLLFVNASPLSPQFFSRSQFIPFFLRCYFFNSTQTQRVFILELDRLHSRAVLHGIALSSSTLSVYFYVVLLTLFFKCRIQNSTDEKNA